MPVWAIDMTSFECTRKSENGSSSSPKSHLSGILNLEEKLERWKEPWEKSAKDQREGQKALPDRSLRRGRTHWPLSGVPTPVFVTFWCKLYVPTTDSIIAPSQIQQVWLKDRTVSCWSRKLEKQPPFRFHGWTSRPCWAQCAGKGRPRQRRGLGAGSCSLARGWWWGVGEESPASWNGAWSLPEHTLPCRTLPNHNFITFPARIFLRSSSKFDSWAKVNGSAELFVNPWFSKVYNIRETWFGEGKTCQ